MSRRSKTIPFLRSPRNNFHQLLSATNLGNTTGFPINAAEVSECPFYRSGRRHLPLLPCAVCSRREHHPRTLPGLWNESGRCCSCARRSGAAGTRFDSARLSHCCSPSCSGKESLTAVAQLHRPQGRGGETEPTPNFFNPSAIGSSRPLRPKAD